MRFAGDQQDVTARNLTSAEKQLASHSGVALAKQVAPLGGRLETTIVVDAASGKLKDQNATASALNEILLTYKASGSLPGTFRLESYGGALFVEPAEMRNSTGSTMAATPILSAPITLSVTQRNAFETLQLILTNVSKNSGFKVGIGTVPIQALATTRVTINVDREPASHALVF